jgi:predicted Zn-dependent protease
MHRLVQFVCRAGLSVTLTATLVCAGDSKKDDPSQIGNRDVSKGVNFYSLEKERALGRQLAQEVERQAKIVDDPLISEYINRVGQNLVRNSDAKGPFTFKVIESSEVNAFALPGGYVFIYSGLIRIADEEDELAAAMAHEIAHVAARHMTRQATKDQLVTMAASGIGLRGWTGYATRQAASLAIPMTFLSFARKDESEADYLGVQYLYAAGYDPTGALSIFEKMEALERRQPGTISRAFSTHPMDADRMARTENEIQAILPPRNQYLVNTSDYTAIRQRLMARETAQPKSSPEQPTLKTGQGAGVPGGILGPGRR